jgi:hypothetical protein
MRVSKSKPNKFSFFGIGSEENLESGPDAEVSILHFMTNLDPKRSEPNAEGNFIKSAS